MDCEGPDVYSIEYPIARSTHTCCECGLKINPGEKYEKFKGLWDGEWDRFKTCMKCSELRDRVNWLHRNDGYEAIPFGCLEEWAREDGFEFPVGKRDDER